MKILESIEVKDGSQRTIQLWQGDLTELSTADRVDALVVSAFPDDYTPTPGSMIGALDRKRVSVRKLADDKDIDLRETMSCWLSRDIEMEGADLGFRRIIVFEPRVRGEPPEVVGDIFRFLMPIVTVRPEIKSVALSIVAAGDQEYPLSDMLNSLVEAATHWLDAGLPLDRVIIAVHRERDSEDARRVFLQAKALYFTTAPVSGHPMEYDAFISYSRQNAAECDLLVAALHESHPDIRVFVDRHELEIGVAWQMKIYESLDRCERVVALLSPQYLSSKMCLEEFNIALARGRKTDRHVIFPVFLYSADLPTYMTMSDYIDCREAEPARIQVVSESLIKVLEADAQKRG